MNRIGLSLVILAFLLSGCSAPARSMEAPYEPKAVESGVVPAAPLAVAPMQADAANFETAGSGANESAVDQMIMQNATIAIAVADPAKSMDAIIKMAEEMKGSVANSNIYKTRNENGLELPEAHLTIRVPADRMTEAMERIKAQVPDPTTDVLSETRTGQNVTKEYTDLKSRLKNLEDAEAQLREIMASATRTEDVMSVFNQLTQVREQIEVIKGQMKYYEESTAMSSIEITVKSKSAIAPLSIGGWQPAGVARDAIQSLINALKFFANAAIWIVLFLLPVLIILFIPVWLAFLIIRAIVRRGRAKKEAAKAKEEPSKNT